MTIQQSNLKKVRIQLKWYHQSQFAGMYMAKEKGFFAEDGIEAEFIAGNPSIDINQRVASGFADFGVSSLDAVMQNQQMGLPILSIAQIFQSGSQGIATLKSSGIDTIPKLAGKTIGTPGVVNELQLLAFLRKFHLWNRVNLVIQKSMSQLLVNEIDAAYVAIYNQLQPPFEKGLKPDDLNILMFNQLGVGMLEDTIIASKQLVHFYPHLCTRVVRAILKGWRYAFTHPDEAIDVVMNYMSMDSNTRVHEPNMLKSVQGLILPKGFSLYDIGRFYLPTVIKTADVLFQYGLIPYPIELNQVIEPYIMDMALRSCNV